MIDVTTLTFLFTDIEGSTVRWEQQPHLMTQALARHDTLLHEHIAACGGTVFKTVGDAFCAVFPTPDQAVTAALAAQRAITVEPWHPLCTIRVRMALHTGTAEHRGGDFFGATLNRVARLLAAGHGGQILLSAAARAATATLPAAEIRDLGQHRLRDLLQPEHIFQLLGTGLPPIFAPLRTLEQRPQNLPLHRTLLIGRERELTDVRALVRRSDVGLVTLTGVGGTGKTRLAVQVAADLLDEFDAGVHFVDLTPIHDPTLVASTIAQSFGLLETGADPPLGVLRRHLHAKHLLLILDNFEHVLPAASVVADLLASAPRLKVLVTSRAVLHLSGEHEYPVPPLQVLSLAVGRVSDGDLQPPAVALFIQRAQAVQPGFSPTGAQMQAIAEICRRLDGLPLAIELAAARMKLVPPEEVLSRLDRRFKLLTGGPRDAPGRHQTLRATLDWSYTLLNTGEQALFRRLGVFVGGWTLAAADAICAAEPEIALDALDGLTALLDQSLLQRELQGDGAPRFRMLETIRAFAHECLAASPEARAVHARHAQYYLALAERAAPELDGMDAVRWAAWLESDIDNLRAALAWSRSDPMAADDGARMAAVLQPFWLRSHLSEGIATLEAYLTDTDVSARPRAWTLYALGRLRFAHQDFVRARTHYEQAQQLFRKVVDPEGEAYALLGLGNIASLNDEATAAGLYHDALARFQALDDPIGTLRTLYWLGNITWPTDNAAARRYYTEALALARSRGRVGDMIYPINNLGNIAIAEGDLTTGQALTEEAIALARQIGDRGRLARILPNLGILATMQHDYQRAQQNLQEALRLAHELGLTAMVAGCLQNIADVATAQGNPEQALRLLGAIDRFFEETEQQMDPVVQAVYHDNIAENRALLDPEVADTAWAAGRALSFDQAVALALQ